MSIALTASLAAGAISLIPTPSHAFCGFYVAGADAELFNDATVVVLMRDGKRTVLSMQNAYRGPPEAFAMVVPVPVVLSEDDVKVLRPELFDRVETLSSPRLVEYWEQDPCGDGYGVAGLGLIGTGRGGGGTGSGYGFGGVPTVTVEAEFEVGEYEVVILSATESTGLDTWLRDNGYSIPAGAEPVLRPYVEAGSKFFVAKVDPARVQFDDQGRAMLSPLRMHYDSEEFSLPVRLGLINAPEGGKQDLIVHILAPRTRYELANYPNAFIPTNLDVKAETAERFGEFYVSLFDHTLEKNPGAVITEYAWSAGSCDPCPGPEAALTSKELLELGGDVLDSQSRALRADARPSMTVRPASKGVEADAGVDPMVVRRIVRAHARELESCRESVAAKVPPGAEFSGTLDLEFTVESSGKVGDVHLAEGGVDNQPLRDCLSGRMRRLKFPKPKGKGPATVRLPLVLRETEASAMSFSPTAASKFVLTRLHARYDGKGLGEDLVFESAGPVTGGREWMDMDGEIEQGAKVGDAYGVNNFQGRYVIRHEWTGAIECEEPHRGWWGGPPEGAQDEPKVAKQLATTTRGASLGSFVTAASVETLGVEASAASPKPEAQADAAEDKDGEAEKAEGAPEKAAEAKEAPAKDAPGSCACASSKGDLAGRGALDLGAALSILGLSLGLRRRRRVRVTSG
ncbi:hypothetical protein PPSIR1_41684 [Plesiocystis pacifica SIR-1]|uniref:DUF2330 domain-containing protein n=1 Tax=Plesiocystis pacifica SIR-1 TaxID=391625 RepID=A6G0S8_9BACT|nr:DUF2330 domain-containing protein [Plesiocystis pacifica]EDM80466.1 hypothetical protein PPSIR1_41684 [Plesiocystis pacifica SIR-1]